MSDLTRDHLARVEANANRLAKDMFASANRIGGDPRMALQLLIEDVIVCALVNLGMDIEGAAIVDALAARVKAKLKHSKKGPRL